jgi:GTP-binding protein
MEDLYAALMPLAEEFEERAAADAPEVDVDVAEDEAEGEEEAWRPTKARPLQIAIVGRPNAGKSTLVNQILGEERMLTGPEAGITRDAISVQTEWLGTPMRMFDTAGMRKKS